MQSEARKHEAKLTKNFPPKPRTQRPDDTPYTLTRYRTDYWRCFLSLSLRFGTVYQDNSLTLYNTPTTIGTLLALRSWMVGRMGFPCHCACTIGIHEAAIGMAACNHDEILIPIPFPAASHAVIPCYLAVALFCLPTTDYTPGAGSTRTRKHVTEHAVANWDGEWTTEHCVRDADTD
ncbi:hypothetical protein CDEST_00183 [Colletotrichum destructivum]|uniref:Uncharacterized protein n=1 Tax=Colletotrichum destructivum TaxID=34406 RepID=A0AAX4HVU5_9PEZI|nr:hypothetical protein CDEST_00183 [Colletotrichum destructivum]